MQVIGTCSLCGGAVAVQPFWGGATPPTPTCQRCGATKRAPHGPVIEMEPRQDLQQKIEQIKQKKEGGA